MGAWELRRDGALAHLTLTRPPINALDRGALDELRALVDAVDADADARVLVVASGLPGIFCSGGDLKYWRGVRDAGEVVRGGRSVLAALEALSIPSVAAIDGHVIGDGLALALACDLRIASEPATFRLPETAYGFIPGWGVVRRLVETVGRGHATGLLLTAQSIDAHRASAMGLVDETVPAGELGERVARRAGGLAALSPAALDAARCALRGGDETACFAAVWGGRDWHEGIEAMLARRPPRFGRWRETDDGDDRDRRGAAAGPAGGRDRCCGDAARLGPPAEARGRPRS